MGGKGKFKGVWKEDASKKEAWREAWMAKKEAWKAMKQAWMPNDAKGKAEWAEAHAAKAWLKLCKGNGKGKAFAMLKGKGKGKGKADAMCNPLADDHSAWCSSFKPCAREGCTFAATWHPSHCCNACARGKDSHGRCC